MTTAIQRCWTVLIFTLLFIPQLVAANSCPAGSKPIPIDLKGEVTCFNWLDVNYCVTTSGNHYKAIYLKHMTYTSSPCAQLVEECTPGMLDGRPLDILTPVSGNLVVFTDSFGTASSNISWDDEFQLSVDPGILHRADCIHFVVASFNEKSMKYLHRAIGGKGQTQLGHNDCLMCEAGGNHDCAEIHNNMHEAKQCLPATATSITTQRTSDGSNDVSSVTGAMLAAIALSLMCMGQGWSVGDIYSAI